MPAKRSSDEASSADESKIRPGAPWEAADRACVERALRERRTINRFQSQLPPREWILEALELARFAPNHKLSNPWRFYLLGRRTVEKVAGLNARLVREAKGEEAARKKLTRWLEMPGWLAVTHLRSDDRVREREDYAATACAIHNLSLALWTRGVGVKWTTGEVTRHPDFYEAIGADPFEETCAGLLWYGFPEDVPQTRRTALDELLHERP
ncbi:MAG: nitroreductase family protein [Planctomycetota bacterium]|jgi:nitroreductase